MKKDVAFDYELIDCGDKNRIERFGDRIIRRSCPMALWRSTKNSRLIVPPDASFKSGNTTKNGWTLKKGIPDSWNISVGPFTVELRFSKNGQVGMFPEQLSDWKWIAQQIKKQPNKPMKVLNGFGYTGIATLHASAANTQVCHVDGAKSAINWAKRNAELSHMAEANIRWICDDMMKFMQREIRRGNRYDAIILDPPAFGRGGGQIWKIEKDLPKMMKAVEALLVDLPRFVVLTCHAPRHFSAQDLAQMLEAIPQFNGYCAEVTFLEIPSKNGNPLLASFGARITRFA